MNHLRRSDVLGPGLLVIVLVFLVLLVVGAGVASLG
jgi:hypothetical protein